MKNYVKFHFYRLFDIQKSELTIKKSRLFILSLVCFCLKLVAIIICSITERGEKCGLLYNKIRKCSYSLSFYLTY